MEATEESLAEGMQLVKVLACVLQRLMAANDKVRSAQINCSHPPQGQTFEAGDLP